MKRYCQTLKLKDNEELISSYISVHENVWPEVLQGMRQDSRHANLHSRELVVHDRGHGG